MWFRQVLHLSAGFALCALPAHAITLPSVQAAWLRDQLVAPAVAQVKEGVQLVLHGTENAYNDIKAAYALDSNAVNIEGLPSDLWERFTQLGDRAENYARDVLEKNSRDLGVLSEARRFQDAVRDVVTAVGPLSTELQTVAGAQAESVSDEIGKVLMALLEELQREFPSPDQAPHHEARRARVQELYLKAEDAIVRVLVDRGLPKERARSHLERLRPHVVNLIVTTGDLAEQHPILLGALLAVGVTMLIPEQWLLRPLLSLFGFGPYGPVKGSFAAWAQRFFYGAAVPEGTWFSLLQHAAMAPIRSGWWKTIFGGLFVGIGAVGAGSSCLGR